MNIIFGEGVNETMVILREPYDPGMRRLFLYKNSKQIFYSDIAFCNRNGVCDYYEDSITCPADCQAEKKDSTNASNVLTPAKKEGDSSYMGYLLFAFLIILIVVAFVFYRKNQAAKIKKEREDFIKWKEEQERLKTAGKPPF